MNMAEAIANPLIVYVKRSARSHTTDVSQGPRLLFVGDVDSDMSRGRLDGGLLAEEVAEGQEDVAAEGLKRGYQRGEGGDVVRDEHAQRGRAAFENETLAEPFDRLSVDMRYVVGKTGYRQR